MGVRQTPFTLPWSIDTAVNEHQEYAIKQPLTPANPWAVDQGHHQLFVIASLTAHISLIVRAGFKDEWPSWSVLLIPWNAERKTVNMAEVSAEGRSWLYQLAVGSLDGVGEEPLQVIDCDSMIAVIKSLTEAEMAMLGGGRVGKSASRLKTVLSGERTRIDDWRSKKLDEVRPTKQDALFNGKASVP